MTLLLALAGERGSKKKEEGAGGRLGLTGRGNRKPGANQFCFLGTGTRWQDLAGQGNWIKMVDIARVAIMYLLGGMYLDTDMDLGPRTFSSQGA